MAAAPPVVFHQPKHAHPDEEHNHHHHRGPAPRLPVIPDLRFEYSYLRSIQHYIQVERVLKGGSQDQPTDVELVDRTMLPEEGFETLDASLGMTGKETEEGFVEGNVILAKPSTQEKSGPSEVIHVQWKKVAWVTVRDQVISPLVQGALWALAGYYIRPFSADLGSRMGTFVHGYLPTKEGLGISWLRGWAKTIGLTGSNNYRIQKSSK